jgi:hypothetical protein
MKWIVVAAAVAVGSLLSCEARAQAKVNLPIICGEAERMTAAVFGEQYREAPFAKWDINAVSGAKGLVTNRETGSVTIFMIRDDVACMLTSGTNFSVYDRKSSSEKIYD